MVGRPERLAVGAWISTASGERARVVEAPLVQDGQVLIQTDRGLYRVPYGSRVQFFTAATGPL